ncbi:MAG: signal recognition particle-docking protein FtsY [Oligoflexales bacterium]|nr:signal recognition particle-docking protein FtsY [Oligoflexales bacterium]
MQEEISSIWNAIFENPQNTAGLLGLLLLLTSLGFLSVLLLQRLKRRAQLENSRKRVLAKQTAPARSPLPSREQPPQATGETLFEAIPTKGPQKDLEPQQVELTQAPLSETVSTEVPQEELEPRQAEPTREPSEESSLVEEIRAFDQKSWIYRLKENLSKTRTALRDGLHDLFIKKPKLNPELLENIHEILYRCDMGGSTVNKFMDLLENKLKASDEINWETVRGLLVEESRKILEKTQSQEASQEGDGTTKVILIVGVNGVGKTTTIGKLAAHYRAQGKSVLLCAADTYRAAAIDQLKIWGDRLGVKVISHEAGSDPAAVAFDAVASAKAKHVDILLIDTAGRLHNKTHLMAELQKIHRVIGKEIPGAPHDTLLILDATTGQNAFMQVKAFMEVVKLSGLCVTKLDGTAKGGVLLGLADQFQLPVQYIGIGEKATDLRRFNASEFAESLFS